MNPDHHFTNEMGMECNGMQWNEWNGMNRIEYNRIQQNTIEVEFSKVKFSRVQ